MSPEVVETIALDVIAAWQDRDRRKMARLLADEFKATGILSEAFDKEMFMLYQCVMNEAFPDWKFNIVSVVVHDNTVHVLTQPTATHTDGLDVQLFGLPLPIIPATLRRIQGDYQVLTFSIEDNHVVACNIQGGLMTLLEQIGVVGWRIATPVMN
jgi:predicted ester cyclase